MAHQTTTRPQKLLFVITKSNWGGAQKYVYDLATEFSKRGYDASVAAGGYGEMLERLENERITVFHLAKLCNTMNPFSSVGSLLEMVRLFKKERPRVVHLNSSKVGLLGGIAARIAGVPRIIFTAHGWPFNEERSSLQKLLLRLFALCTVHCAHVTICVSKKTLEQLDPPLFLARKCTVIHNGIAPIQFKQPTSFYDEFRCVRKEKVALVSIGELHKSKGFDLALNYLKDLQDLSWEWYILGEGKERHALDSLVKSYGLSSRVHIMGHVQNASSYLPSFDIFFLPSRTEALGYVAIEALQSNLPIIASDAGGIPEVLGNDPGSRLVDMRARSTENALREILSHPPQKITSGRDELRKEFSLERMVDKTIGVYSELDK